MDILEAFDLTGSLRDAAELAGCSHHTVARYVAAREKGRCPGRPPARRPGVIDPFLAKLEELVERSQGKVRADVAHEKITAMGYAGSERTTRRAVARLKANRAAGRRRVYRPWIPEPGMWAQYDFGDGPRVGGTATILFCLWLAWSRFRVVLPLLDKSRPSVLAAIDVALRRIGGCPTYLLTDNEKTVTVEHVAGIPVRNPGAVAFGRHYGLTVATCVPADPASKGGSESTVRIAKADLVPTEANLLPDYAVLRGAGGGVRGVLRPGQRPAAPGHPPGPGRDAGRGAGPAAPGPGGAVHRGARGDPEGGRPVDGVVRGRPVLGAAPARRAGGLGPPPRRAGRDHPRRASRPGRGRPPPGDRPGQPQRPRRALPAGAARRAEPHAGPGRRPRPSSWPSGTAPGCGWPRQPPPAPAGSGPRWPTPSSWPRCTAPPTSTGRWARPPRPAGSPRVTWPPSSPTRPRLPPARWPRASEPPLAQGTSGWAALGTARR